MNCRFGGAKRNVDTTSPEEVSPEQGGGKLLPIASRPSCDRLLLALLEADRADRNSFVTFSPRAYPMLTTSAYRRNVPVTSHRARPTWPASTSSWRASSVFAR